MVLIKWVGVYHNQWIIKEYVATVVLRLKQANFKVWFRGYSQTSVDDVIISQSQVISQVFSSYPPQESFVKLAN